MKCFKALVSVTALCMLICGILLITTQEAQAVPVLKFTSTTFKQKYNSVGAKLGTGLKVTKMSAITGKNSDAMTLSVNSPIFDMFCGIDKKSKKLDSVTQVTVFSDTQDAAQSEAEVHEMLLGMAQLIATVDPQLTAQQRGQFIKDMGFFDSGFKPGSEGKKILGKHKYFYSITGAAGTWFGVEAIK